MPTISVRLNPTWRENNRSSFSAFGGRTWARFIVETGEPPRAGSTEPTGRIWARVPDFADPCCTIRRVQYTCR